MEQPLKSVKINIHTQQYDIRKRLINIHNLG